MAKPKNSKNAKRTQQAKRNKARSNWANRGNNSNKAHLENPKFLALVAGTKETFKEGCLENPPQISGLMSSGGEEYAFMYGKDYSIPNRDFIGKTYKHDGKFYLASWTELLHPETAQGGIWVNREYDQLPTSDDFNAFLWDVMTRVLPFIQVSEAWLFAPLHDYNMRLLGLDALPPEYLTPERLIRNMTELMDDLKTDVSNVAWTHHV